MKHAKMIGEILFESDSEYEVSFENREFSDEIVKVGITVDLREEAVPEPVVIRWTLPCKNVFSQWNSALWSQRVLNPNWMPVRNASRSAEGTPLQTHLSLDGTNAVTVSTDDPMTPMELATGIMEETAEISYKLTLFTERISPIKQYNVTLTVDFRKKPYLDIIRQASEGFKGREEPIPTHCGQPMYSTWYAYHQDLSEEVLLRELRLAKSLGMETVIIDDGWQTEDDSRGYAYCGDWKPLRLKDMKKLAAAIHAIGMKCMVWFGVPFVGIHSSAWSRFQGKFLDSFDEAHPWCVLDPRYPEVRRYLEEIYEKAVKEWEIDGLKLDFINNMKLSEASGKPNAEMDFESLEEAIEALLSEIKDRLTAIRPDLMLEFRQPYTGPVMCRYGNMLRVADCPLDALKNRAGIIDLRTLSNGCAVHSDMLMWHYEDSPESAALQIINILFGVPQISVRIEELPTGQRKMLEFYLSFWKKNQDCLLSGRLRAQNPEAGYSLVSVETEEKLIAVSYIKNVLRIEKRYKEIVFINGSWEKELILYNTQPACRAKYRIYDCMGNITEEQSILFEEGVRLFPIPDSGMLYIDLVE